MLDPPGDSRTGQELFQSETQKLDLEQRNSYRLSRAVVRIAGLMIRRDTKITPAIIRLLQRFTIRDIYSCAGRFRTWSVLITGSLHRPPRQNVEVLVEAMCDFANEKSASGEWDALQIAAYLLWRLNWIHPFGGGNGRTSRALAYLVICVHLGKIPQGKLSIAEQIDQNRARYQAALEDADTAWKEYNITDVSKLTELLDEYLKNQIRSAATVQPGNSTR